jgi:hypothetical protein
VATKKYFDNETKTKEYKAWSNMISRCHSESQLPNSKYYKELGIVVCERWRYSFENFLDDMGPAPTPKHSLDRFPDKEGNYEPENCRWATQKEQCNNLRRNIIIEHSGNKKTLPEWATELNISPWRLYLLHVRHDLSISEILSGNHHVMFRKRLTPAQAQIIRNYSKSGMNIRKISAAMDIDMQSIRRVIKGKTFNEII